MTCWKYYQTNNQNLILWKLQKTFIWSSLKARNDFILASKTSRFINIWENRKTPMLESGFNEVAGLKVSNFTKKRARGKFPSHTLKVFFFLWNTSGRLPLSSVTLLYLLQIKKTELVAWSCFVKNLVLKVSQIHWKDLFRSLF